MDPHLRLQPGQQILTPAQEAETRRFAQERIAAQLSTEPVDEPETERLLCQAYAVAGLPPPQRIIWLDGPLHLVAMRAPESKWWDRVGISVGGRVALSVRASVWESVRASVWDVVGDRVWASVWENVRDRVGHSVGHSVGASVAASMGEGMATDMAVSVSASVAASVWAYHDADWLAFYRWFDAYKAPNALQALAHFNERVSGYWLGRGAALLVRRPTLSARDHEGRLHSAKGMCLAYSDGWGFYAWHGVRVPEPVILSPEQLMREDVLNAPNVEVRRVIQERMGERFVWELGGYVIDTGPRRTLYEVRLPADDPDRVARYIQVQDASTARQYFLRVPPTIQTSAEAVAWSFSCTREAYQPVREPRVSTAHF